MELALRQDAINETFRDTERLVYHTIHRFIRTYGGEFEDLMELVGPTFMRAYDGYDRHKSKFSARLSFLLWKEFLEQRRKSYRKKNQLVVYGELDPEAYQAPTQFDRFTFLDSLSEDARLVVLTVFDTPWQFEPEPKTIRFILCEYLKGLSWNRQRITESFQEIRLALEGGAV